MLLFMTKLGNNHSIDKNKTAASRNRNRPGLIKVCQAARANLTLFRGQSAMDTRKASTSSIASSIAYSYFSIETSEDEVQQSGTTGH